MERPLDRRRFLATLGKAATGAAILPATGWAAVGAPAYLAATRDAQGTHRLIGLGEDGGERFAVPLPARGHAAAAHPSRPEAVAFARRPGRFALVIDCADGRTVATLDSPAGRHFYGHGVFSADGALLFTTENAYETGDGRIGIWDVAEGYRRVGDVPSGGIGPHDLQLMPDGETLVVANGGIRTHPDSGREKLNLDTMAPALSYLRARDGALVDEVTPPGDFRQNSIRHLAISADGTVAAAMQWQGDPADGVPLLAFHRRGEAGLSWAEAAAYEMAAMEGYAGSVSFSRSGAKAAITSPRGGRIMAWEVAGGAAAGPEVWSRPDVCGLAPGPTGWIATDGLGGVIQLDEALTPVSASRHDSAFDNHLVALLKNC
ncbi:MAG: DUF1513 domain-containing protein [Pseudomonadota bacterium]